MATRIFLVEDDPTCEAILRGLIYSVAPDAEIECHESAEQALFELEQEFAAEKPVDLIISDIYLSGKATGLDLWQTCREYFPRVPVLVTSSLSMDRFFNSVGSNNICPIYLPKPYILAECRQTLAAMLP